MDYILAGVSALSIIIAFISLFLAYRSVTTGRRSIEALSTVRQEIDTEFAKIKTTNEDTQSLIARITRLFNASEREGLEMVYANRMDALREFAPYIVDEKEKVVIVGSSLLGLLLFIAGFEDMVRQEPAKFRFVLTHPTSSRKREGPEGRDPGVIQGEILEGLHKLREWGVPLENIQLYKGSPTVFMIATSQHMLLNPYPYGTEAYRCFCLQVSSQGSIFDEYYEKHYKKIWDSKWTATCSDFLRQLKQEQREERAS